MIFGETRTLRLDVSSTQAFAITTPTLALTYSDGSVAAPAVTDSVSSGPDHVLTADVTPPLPGPFNAVWSYGVGTQRRKAQEYYTATYRDVYGLTLDRLQLTPATAPEALLDPAIARTIRSLQDRFYFITPTAPAYATLPTEADKDNFDDAIALLTAACLRPILGKIIPVGEIQSIDIGTQHYSFDSLGRARVKDLDTIEQGWLTEAEQKLGAVSIIRAYYLLVQASFNPMLTITGPTRRARSMGLVETPIIHALRLLVDDWKAQPLLQWRGTIWG